MDFSIVFYVGNKKKLLEVNLDRNDWVLIQRYVTGKADVEERQFINQWMKKDSENRKLIQDLNEIWTVTSSENFHVDVETAWTRFQAKRIKPGRITDDKISKNARKKFSRMPVYFFRAAAVLLATLFTVYFVELTFTGNDQPEVVSDFYVMQTFKTEKGEKASVTFSDGSKVMLNSGSTLRFPKEFHETKREVYLEGEAYFEITYDSDQPFIVYNQHAEIEVLGTKFNVQGWGEDEFVEVAVREGKVAVGLQNDDDNYEGIKRVLLTEGLYTEVYSGNAPTPPREVSVNNYLIWTRGGLNFENTPFRKVIRDIERRFDVEITGVNEELLDVPYTGTFLYAELDEVLSVIAVSMNLQFERAGSEIIFE